MIKFKSNSKRLKQELLDLEKENKNLFDLLADLNLFCTINFSKDAVITMIYRTQEEQDNLYRNSPKYKKRKFKSSHQFWHGVDIRSWNFTPKQVNKIEEYLNSKYNKTNFYKWTAKAHNVGSGIHFHIQYTRRQ